MDRIEAEVRRILVEHTRSMTMDKYESMVEQLVELVEVESLRMQRMFDSIAYACAIEDGCGSDHVTTEAVGLIALGLKFKSMEFPGLTAEKVAEAVVAAENAEQVRQLDLKLTQMEAQDRGRIEAMKEQSQMKEKSHE